MTITTLERTGEKAMPARKLRPSALPAPRSSRPTTAACTQPRYHTEISDDYLEAMQRQVDALKPEGFQLNPISEPGW